MNVDVFVDTNVLLYAIDDDPAAESKRQRSQNLLESERWGWSVQLATEFFVNATSTKRPFRLTAAGAVALLETWFTFPTVELTPALFRADFAVHQRFQLSYWDAVILADARQLSCRVVYSEDLNAGQDYDGVTVVDPFATAQPP